MASNKTLTEEEYLRLYRSILNILQLYHTAMTSKDGWLTWYKDSLKVRPHEFLYDENQELFYTKLERTFDLFELAYVYCKITNQKSYIKENHMSTKAERVYVLDKMKLLSEGQFHEMKSLLKVSILCGMN